jgi:hypothetical protein
LWQLQNIFQKQATAHNIDLYRALVAELFGESNQVVFKIQSSQQRICITIEKDWFV